jgi:hypothetical protein
MKKSPISFQTYHNLYAFLFFLNVFGILALGIFPGVQSIVKKQQFLADMKDKSEQFDVMIETAKEKNQLYAEVEPYLPALDKAILNESYGDQIIVELLFLVSKSGYKLEKVGFLNRDETYTTLTLTLEGSFASLDTLIEDMETADMSIVIDTLKVSFYKKDPTKKQRVTMNIKIFNLKDSDTDA